LQEQVAVVVEVIKVVDLMQVEQVVVELVQLEDLLLMKQTQLQEQQILAVVVAVEKEAHLLQVDLQEVLE